MNNETYKYLKFWQQKINEKLPISQTMKIYTPKYKWQKILPFWILKLFVKPTSFYNCFPTQIESIVNTNNEFTYNVKFSYKDVE
jgi:hypothetical protein